MPARIHATEIELIQFNYAVKIRTSRRIYEVPTGHKRGRRHQPITLGQEEKRGETGIFRIVLRL